MQEVYYKLAGEAGCIEAYLRLSPIHFYGINVEKNTRTTMDFLEKAVKLGSSIAFSRLKTIYIQSADTHFEKSIACDKTIPFIDSTRDR